MKNRWMRVMLTLSLTATLFISSVHVIWGKPAAVHNLTAGTAQMADETVDAVGEDYITSGNYQYQIQTIDGVNYAYLKRYTGREKNIRIKEQIDGYTVRGILLTTLFLDNYETETVTLPSTIKSIGAGAFATAFGLREININKTSGAGFHSVDGVLFNGKQLVAYPAGKIGDTYIIPDGISTILMGAFYGCKNLTEVVIPESAITLARGVFTRCKNPLKISLKYNTLNPSMIGSLNTVCCETAQGTKLLVKTEDLKRSLLPGMKATNVFAGSTATMEVDTKVIKAAELAFTDGGTKKSITVSKRSSAEGYELAQLYRQTPLNTTENVSWTVTSGSDVCHVSKESQLLYTDKGGDAVLEGKDETGNTITLHVAVTNPIDKFELEFLGASCISEGEETSIFADILPDTSYAYNSSILWESSDSNVIKVEEGAVHTGKIKGMGVGTATVTATINDNGYLVSKSVAMTVRGDITSCTVDPIPVQSYTGTQVTPKPIVRYHNRILIEGEDYNLSYGQNSFGGEKVGSIYIEGRETSFSKGNPMTVYFSIKDETSGGNQTPPPSPPPPSLPIPSPLPPPVQLPPIPTENTPSTTPKVDVSKPSLKSVKSKKKKTLDVTWKKNSKVTGYQLQYSANSKFKKGTRTINIKKYKITSYTIKKLKSNKKYYIRIRSYKKVKGRTYYSSWSSKKTVRVK